MKRIKLKLNDSISLFAEFYTVVDDDFELGIGEEAEGRFVGNHVYANIKTKDIITKKVIFIPFHRRVVGLQSHELGIDVDHINGNSLDNRKSNLRILSRSEHMKSQKRFSKAFRNANTVFLPKIENLTIYNYMLY